MKVTINLNKDEIQHLKYNFDCAYDCCGTMQKILEKVRNKAVGKPKKYWANYKPKKSFWATKRTKLDYWKDKKIKKPRKVSFRRIKR